MCARNKFWTLGQKPYNILMYKGERNYGKETKRLFWLRMDC